MHIDEYDLVILGWVCVPKKVKSIVCIYFVFWTPGNSPSVPLPKAHILGGLSRADCTRIIIHMALPYLGIFGSFSFQKKTKRSMYTHRLLDHWKLPLRPCNKSTDFRRIIAHSTRSTFRHGSLSADPHTGLSLSSYSSYSCPTVVFTRHTPLLYPSLYPSFSYCCFANFAHFSYTDSFIFQVFQPFSQYDIISLSIPDLFSYSPCFRSDFIVSLTDFIRPCFYWIIVGLLLVTI